MTERDPRTDPKVGDKLRLHGTALTVIQSDKDRGVFYVAGPKAISAWAYWENWQICMEDAEVIHAAD